MIITSEQIAYAAGLLDGEGCIHISRHPTRSGERYGLTVMIQMTVSEPLMFMQDLFGGVLRPAKKPTNKQQWYWGLCSKEAVPLLEQVLPYLKIKYIEAAIALLFQETFKQDYPKSGNSHPVLPENILAIRKFCCEECRTEKRFNA